LAIVAALVAAHDGMVSVESSPGRGATFLVTLPLAPEAQGGPSPTRSEAGTEAPLGAPVRMPPGSPSQAP
ncbi:MAG: sensor histidine kinase, partial [Nocardiopsaceae bacterium]|nr:sensor histidine kinase [Nocardiopsaceae bacterium]